jgi:hypothetical protein
VSLEPNASTEAQNFVLLNPWCFYGRQRTFEALPPSRLVYYGYLLARQTASRLPQGPEEADALQVSAESLELVVEGSS